MRQCQVPGCTRDADYEVFLSSFNSFPAPKGTTVKPDLSCLFICECHAAENEQQAQSTRSPTSPPQYLYTNREHAHGFTIYRPIGTCAGSHA